jgi:hypothetical protein
MVSVSSITAAWLPSCSGTACWDRSLHGHLMRWYSCHD